MKPDQIAADEHFRMAPHRSADGPAFGPIVVGIVVLLGSLSNFLAYHKYPFLTYEVGIIAASLIAVAAIAGILYRGQRAWGKILMEVLLATIAVDLNTDGFILPALTAVAALIANLALKKSVLPLLAITGSIVLATSLLGLTESRKWMSEKLGAQRTPASSAPAILHIILDEHIGIEGLPPDNPATPSMKVFLKEFYVSHGFRLFGRAHSQYFQTVHSIPQILNYGGRSHGTAGLNGGSVGRNEYFSQLQRKGYNLHIIQSEWLDMCSASSFTSCKTYWSPSLQAIAKSSMNIEDRLQMMFFKFLALSEIASKSSEIYDRKSQIYFEHGIDLGEIDLKRRAKSSTVTALFAFDELSKDLKVASPGDAYTRLPKQSYRAMLIGLRQFIEGCNIPHSKTVWSDYASDNSYAAGEAASKLAFVLEMVAAVQPRLLFDLGCNSGDYSEAALQAGAEMVVGFDYDFGALEAAARRSRKSSLHFLPLWLDAANPSPSQGWAQAERKGLSDRAQGDALIALAFIHHIAIARNVPLDMTLDWIMAMAPVGILEFPPKNDPMVQRLLANREDIFPEYSEQNFLFQIEQRATVVKCQHLSQGGRLLVWYDRRNSS